MENSHAHSHAARRILIIGSPGSGKSQLARRLGQATGIPVFHLDQHFWKPGWQEPPVDVSDEVNFVWSIAMDKFDFIEQLNKSKVRGNIVKRCEWCNLSEEDKKYLLSDTKYWTLYLADEQDYIGRCIFVLKRHCGSLPELKDDEWMELFLLINKYENCVKTVFNAEHCNWSCLMNSFYKSPEPCPHVHIHVRPRYKNPVVINGNTYLDNNFGHHYSSGRTEQMCSREDFQTIYGLIKKWLE